MRLETRQRSAFHATHGGALVAINAALIAILAWFAFILAMPEPTFTTSPGYHLFAEIMSEDAWAATFGTAAAIGLAGLFSRSKLAWTISALTLSTMHGAVAILVCLGNPEGIGSGAFFVIACLGYYLVWRRAS